MAHVLKVEEEQVDAVTTVFDDIGVTEEQRRKVLLGEPQCASHADSSLML